MSGANPPGERSEPITRDVSLQFYNEHMHKFAKTKTYCFTLNVNNPDVLPYFNYSTISSFVCEVFFEKTDAKRIIFSVENKDGKIHAHGLVQFTAKPSYEKINTSIPGCQMWFQKTIYQNPKNERERKDIAYWAGYCSKETYRCRYVEYGKNFFKMIKPSG